MALSGSAIPTSSTSWRSLMWLRKPSACPWARPAIATRRVAVEDCARVENPSASVSTSAKIVVKIRRMSVRSLFGDWMLTLSRGDAAARTLLSQSARLRLRRIGRRLGRRFGGVRWLADAGHAFHVEALIVGIPRHRIDLECLHHQHTDSDVRLFVRWQPDFVVDIRLFKNEARSLLQVCHHPARKTEVADEVRFQARDIVRLFVDPDDAGEFVDHFFGKLVRLELGIRLEVEN